MWTRGLLPQIGEYVLPRWGIVGGFVVLQLPLLFRPVQLAQIVHAGVARWSVLRPNECGDDEGSHHQDAQGNDQDYWVLEHVRWLSPTIIQRTGGSYIKGMREGIEVAHPDGLIRRWRHQSILEN